MTITFDLTDAQVKALTDAGYDSIKDIVPNMADQQIFQQGADQIQRTANAQVEALRATIIKPKGPPIKGKP